MSGKQLRILSFGAGAIGTYIGGSLALQGHPVVFLERPQVVNKLRQQGLTLQIMEHEHHLPNPKMASSLEGALASGPFDLALFALKSFDTPAALAEIKPYQEVIPAVYCTQNGIENEAAIGAVLGQSNVIAGTVTSAIGRLQAGHIILERFRGMGVAAGHPLSKDLTAFLNQAGLNARLYARSADMKWSKMLTNLIANATSAILDMTPAEVYAHPGLCNLEVLQLREALRVMSALDIQVVDLPGTPVRALAFAVRNLPMGLARVLLKNAVSTGRGGKMPSFHIDLHSGRGQSEVDYLNGAVVRFGEQAGIPTPANRFLNHTLSMLIAGELSVDFYARQPQKLLVEFEKSS